MLFIEENLIMEENNLQDLLNLTLEDIGDSPR